MADAQTLVEALERLMRVDPTGSASGCAIRRCRGGTERQCGHFRITEMAAEIGEHQGMRPEGSPLGGYPLVFK